MKKKTTTIRGLVQCKLDIGRADITRLQLTGEQRNYVWVELDDRHMADLALLRTTAEKIIEKHAVALERAQRDSEQPVEYLLVGGCELSGISGRLNL